jgi:hypothetical protein
VTVARVFSRTPSARRKILRFGGDTLSRAFQKRSARFFANKDGTDVQSLLYLTPLLYHIDAQKSKIFHNFSIFIKNF